MPDAQIAAVARSGLHTFGDYLKYLRRRAQLTQAELAIACGYSPPHISHLENNQRFPDQSTLLALFVPALGLQDEPELVERMLALAASARQATAAPAETGQATTLPRHNLPVASTPFVGREDELARIEQLLGDPGCRMLTLTGPGGIGKTRLAVQAAARQLFNFADGVFFVSLAGVRSPELIIPTTADALGFSFRTPLRSGLLGGDPFGAAQSSAMEDTRTQLLGYLRGKRLLLVMDNCEHLLDGLDLLPDILSFAPGIMILATSREPLAFQDEWVVPVHGLELPEEYGGKALDTYSAVKLFVQRARHVQVGFSLAENAEAVARICRQVEGLPLSIELAAGLLRAVPIAEIADQIGHNLDLLTSALRDVPERHRSLRAVFEQSWSLLSEVERRALMRLSAFRGGFRRDAASYVTEAPFRVLLALVDKSLVRLSPSGRYDIHELLRQFSEEKLRAWPGEWDTAQGRHCAFYAGFVYERQDRLERDAERNAVEQIEADIDNVRAAWAWAVESRQLEDVDRFVRGLHAFYVIRGWLEEGLATFSQAARMLSDLAPDEGLGSAVFGRIQARQCFYETELKGFAWQDIETRLEQCLSIAQRHGAQWDVAYVYRQLGMCARLQGRRVQAVECLEKCVAIFREIGDLVGAATWLLDLGQTMRESGEFNAAVRCFEESLALAKETGSTHTTGEALNRLAWLSLSMGAYDEAQRRFHEELIVRRAAGYQRAAAFTTVGLANVAFRQGQSQEANRLAHESLETFREIGDRLGETVALEHIGIAEFGLGNYHATVQCTREVIAHFTEMNRPFDVAEWEGNLTYELCLIGEYEEAWRVGDRCVAFYRRNDLRIGLAASIENLAVALAGLGRYREAKRCYLEALPIALERRMTILLLFAVAGMARIMAAEGDTNQALELLGMVLHHPAATSPDILALAQPLLTDLEAELPPEVIAAGMERGKALNLEAVVRDLLEETMPIDAHSEGGENGLVGESDPPPDTPEV